MRRSIVLTVFVAGCTCNSPATSRSLSHNIGASLSTCNDAKTKFIAAKHNVQVAFEPCGYNSFRAYRWSPGGKRVYFQLVMTSYIMDAADPRRTTISLPIPIATANAAWVTAERIVVPIGPEAGSLDARLAIVDVPRQSTEADAPSATPTAIHMWPMHHVQTILSIQRGSTPNALLLVGREAKAAPPRAWLVDLSTGHLQQAFPWLDDSFDTITWSPENAAVLIGRKDTVTWHHAGTGEILQTWHDATRGVMHPNGKWIALESMGAPSSVYTSGTWAEQRQAGYDRKVARMEQFEASLPDHLQGEVTPPVLSFARADGKARWLASAFQGDSFSWYAAEPSWGSFFLWGFEGTKFRRNVALADIMMRISRVEAGEPVIGMVPYTPRPTLGPPPGFMAPTSPPAEDVPPSEAPSP